MPNHESDIKSRQMTAQDHCSFAPIVRKPKPPLFQCINDYLKYRGLSLGDVLNIALFILTIASIGLAWGALRVAQQANLSADNAARQQAELFQRQLKQQERAASDLDRVENRFERLDSLEPRIGYTIYCRDDVYFEAPPINSPFVTQHDQVFDVDETGHSYCQVRLENIGTAPLHGAGIYVHVNGMVGGIPGSTVSKVRNGRPEISAPAMSVQFGPFDLSIKRHGQSSAEEWFAVTSRSNVQEIALEVTFSAQNADELRFVRFLPVRRSERR